MGIPPNNMKARSSICLILLYCLLATAFFLISTNQSLANNLTAKVVSVLDGDTIEVLHHQRPERIRLSGIACPEKGQAYGKRVNQVASALVFGKEVTLQTHGLDKYGRPLADVLLPEGTNGNHTLVKDGWCWWYRKYAPGDTGLEELDRARSARGAERGVGIVPRFKYKPHNHGSRSELFNGFLDTFAFSGFHKAHIPSVLAGQVKCGYT